MDEHTMAAPGQQVQARPLPFVPALTVREVVMDTDETVYVVTETKLRLWELQYGTRLGRRDAWVAPAGLFATLAVTVATTSPRSWLLPASTWRALFIFGAAASLGWLAASIVASARSVTLEDLTGWLRRQGTARVMPPPQQEDRH